MSKYLLVLWCVTLSLQQKAKEIDYYVKLISSANQNAQTYQWPTSARQYRATGNHQYFGSYDFVIIGAGAAGCVAANRLSEISQWNILALEAGDYGNNLTDIPNMMGQLQFTSYNWATNSTPQKTACLGTEGHICAFPRGKGVGGTSLINGLVYARGYKHDFDQWEKIAKDKRWGYDSVLHYYKKSEDFVYNDCDAPVDPAFHDTGGPFRVEYHEPKSPQLEAFLQANKELGFDIADYNANKLGASQSQLNNVKGRRLDSGKAYLEPVLHRKNLKVMTQSYVTKIRLDKGVACGVEFSHKGRNYVVKVKKEVILAAGPIASPQILMLSGVGPKHHLQDMKIAVVADLEVGSNFLDNPLFLGVNVGSNYTEPIKPLKDYVKEFLNGVGPLAIANNNQGVGFYESSYSKGTNSPDVELEFVPANATGALSQKSRRFTDETFEDTWKGINLSQSFLIYVIGIHSISTGSVRLKSNDPYDYPLIDPQFFTDKENKDVNILYEGIQLALRLLETKPFKAIGAKLQGKPLKACKHYEYLTKDYWYCAMQQLTISCNHPMGTCPMGTDPKKGAVVDSHLRVFGFKNLRVADTSVFPLTLAGHPYAPAVMVGEQLGDLVKMKHKSELQNL